MASDDGLTDLELSALMCSKVCHDIISPVGAIANGLEVLDEEEDEEMRASALDLIRKSAKQASAKLQFARLAFGAAGSAGAELDLGEVEDITRGVIDAGRVELEWLVPRIARPKDEVKLLLNLILIALGALPRGGKLVVKLDDGAISVACSGDTVMLDKALAALLSGAEAGDIEARSVHAYYAGRLAESAGLGLAVDDSGAGVSITAAPLKEAA